MKRRVMGIIAVLLIGILATPLSAEAQQAGSCRESASSTPAGLRPRLLG